MFTNINELIYFMLGAASAAAAENPCKRGEAAPSVILQKITQRLVDLQKQPNLNNLSDAGEMLVEANDYTPISLARDIITDYNNSLDDDNDDDPVLTFALHVGFCGAWLLYDYK